jgi:putative copper export protein
MADADTVLDMLHALPLVALQTHYGKDMLARLGLLLVATAFFRPDTTRRTFIILLLAAAALSLQGLIGHAGATEGMLGDSLVASEAFHLLAAGLWLGALLPLWLSVHALPPAQAAAVCERFTPLGIACVLVLAGTGFFQGMDFIGSLPGLFGTPYGHFALLKIALFLSALVLALLNRLWLADRLSAGATAARRHLLLSVCIETGIGLAVVGAAAFMASTTPAMHTTPVWPFPWRFSLDRVTEDPGIRREVIISAALIGAAALLLLGAILWKRFRLPAPARPAAERQRLHNVADLAVIIVRDLNGTIRHWSTGCEKLYGWSAAQGRCPPTRRARRQADQATFASTMPDWSCLSSGEPPIIGARSGGLGREHGLALEGGAIRPSQHKDLLCQA